MAEKSENKFFGPLILQHNKEKQMLILNEPQECVCVLCDSKFSLPSERESLIIHLFTKHKLVIGDINDIADLTEYLRYWRLRFKDESVPYFCTTLLLEGKPDGTDAESNEYYLLCEVLPEDNKLRTNLQQARLEKLLQHQKYEREDKNYEKECLFCRFGSKESRAVYLSHLFEKHNFHIAKPDNLIFIDELINTVSKKLEQLQCIYCEKIFKDRMILKEHMRKKGHKRINPDNKEYDKFFIVNYLGEKGKKDGKPGNVRGYNFKNSGTSRNKEKVNDADSNVDSDPDWSEWTEQNGPLITCLLCDHTEKEFDEILDHMVKEHDFSFSNATKGLDFYLKIKIVNFIRRQVHLKQCWNCDTKFVEARNLIRHLKEDKHFDLNRSKWDQPEYYFPTYEDDLFLCYIQDEDESWWSSDEREENVSEETSEISKEMAMAVLEDS